MNNFASFAQRGRDALINGDLQEIISLIDRNFDQRKKLYGDAVIGEDTLLIVNIARAHGHAAKLTGSGGCVFGISRQSGSHSASTRDLQKELESHGMVFCPITFASDS